MQTKQSFPASTLGWQQQRDEGVAKASTGDAEEVP